MGVYIEGIDMPNSGQIELIIRPHGKVLTKTRGIYAKAMQIDLVRCGECKYMRKYALRSDEPTGIWCHRWSVPRLVTDDGFCSYGERKE